MGITSYAQNFEDVILWRALGHIERGFYVDVGAQHPVVDSVSKAFYERGWHGVHVEPTSFYSGLLRDDRPDELVIQAAIADQKGLLTFFEIPDTGLSTASLEVAEHHRQQGWSVRNTMVPALTLDELFLSLDGEVHWLKVDVEGFEMEVMSGWRESAKRPWLMVIESTYPNSQRETHHAWEPSVFAKGYSLAHIDGLNRYYVSELHPELADALRYGPNVFDGFQLSESSWASAGVRERYGEKLNALSQQKEEVEQQLDTARKALACAEAEAEQSMLAEKEADQAAKNEVRLRAELEQASRAELAVLREALTRAEAAGAERELQAHHEIERRLDAVRADAQMRVQTLIDRERELNDRLAQVQREALVRENELNAMLAAEKESYQNEIAELDRRSTAARDQEAKLRVDLAQEIQRTALIAAEVARMRRSLSWRLTAPLRWLADWRLARRGSSVDEMLEAKMSSVATLVSETLPSPHSAANSNCSEHRSQKSY